MKAFLALFLVLSPSQICYAADPVKHVIDEKEFVCFEVPDAQRLLQIYINFPKLELKIGVLEKLDVNLTAQIQKTTELQDNMVKQAELFQGMTVELQKKLDSMDAWYRSPYLWFAVGVVVSSGVSLGVYYLVK